ncbi:rhodanese-like domain-containing protein [Erysipelotrichaceae bacterium OttesenSCG-928-M19]|nr:rhodanese-like domain-containing protein [Erysipelotrichaceae bacterium OttesenSCG-928-M19]
MFFKKNFEQININEIKEMKNPNIIDVRTKEEYQVSKIKGTKNIELETLLNNPDKYLKKEIQYYIMCASGMRSATACDYLSKLGYQVTNLKGGISAYRE